MHIKRILNQLIAHLPNHGEMIKNIYRRLRYEKRNFTLKFRILFQKYHIPDPEQLYWIDPIRIVYHTNYIKDGKAHFKGRVFNQVGDKGRVYPGDWDLSPHKFEELDVFKAFEQRILHGKNWEETAFYKYELSDIEAGRMRWNCRNEEDWKKRCLFLDSLILSIREKGYVVGHQLNSCQGSIGVGLRPEMSEEITVNIGRNGQYLFQNGRHRLAIAKILGLKRIPVKVLVRHKEWQEFREKLILMAKQNRGATAYSGMLYQPAIHPDFNDISAGHLCEDRFLAIKRSLKFTSGNVLDIGANLAYFCHKFENLGFECYAIENELEISDVANRLRIAEGKKFTIFQGSLFDPQIQKQIHQKCFDVVVALNIFHHFLKTKATFTQFKKWLPKLSLKTMYFEPHLYKEEQMKDSYLNFTEVEFVKFILENTTLNCFEIIHKATDGRRIYRLY